MGLGALRHCIERLAEIYPQLYLDPDREDTEKYRSIVLKGDRADTSDLSHFRMDERDRLEMVDTPAGPVRVVSLFDRHDFEVFVRDMMAAKAGPGKEVPPTMGASTIYAFNWPRIHAHMKAYEKEQKDQGNAEPDMSAEFRRFTADKENYIDCLIVLSRGPYSNVSAAEAGMSDEEWLDVSRDIRLYHECTHVICRKLYPDMIDAVWDELVADATGLYAALGRLDEELERKFLGIDQDGRYCGGRLENYVPRSEGESDEAYRRRLDELSARVCVVLGSFGRIIDENKGRPVFEVMDMMERSMEGSSWK